jgi:c-di-GMP-binding flagellar brake protein YcgR
MKIEPIELWKGQLLEIETNEGSIFQTIVLKDNENDLMLQHPSNQTELLVPALSREVAVYFFDDKNNRYVFDANLAFIDNRFVLPKPDPKQVKRVQRRQFFRVPATLDMWIKKSLDVDEAEDIKFVTDDISGGGVSFHCFNMEPFQKDEILRGEIEVESLKKTIRCPFQAQVVNIIKMDEKRTRYALEFTMMKEMHRKEIMSYCIRRQAEIYKKIGDC